MTYRLPLPLLAIPLLSTLSVSGPARAETLPARDHGIDAPKREARPVEAYPFSVGARSFMAPGFGIAALGVGFDAAYSLLPNLAVGAQHLEYLVDQGADPHYCARCVRSGRTTLAFAEGRLFPAAVATPYARLGLGLSNVTGQLVSGQEGHAESNLSFGAELGLELHYRWASIRLFAFDAVSPTSELDKDAFLAYGVQLGARF